MAADEERNLVSVYLKGFLMGCAEAVPGVSGGTIALITGIYERLIDALSSISIQNSSRALMSLKNRQTGDLTDFLEKTDLYFLSTLFIGMFTALVIFVRLISYMLSNFAVHTYGFFFGLIGVSAAVLFTELDLSTTDTKIAAIAGFLLSFIASGYGASSLGHSLPVIFFSGMVAVTALVLPGISGSLMLIMLGQYEYMTGALNRFLEALIGISQSGSGLYSSLAPVAVFVSGAFIGLISAVYGVEKALDRNHGVTVAFLVSMVLGALRAPLVQLDRHLVGSIELIPVFIGFGAAAALGGALILVLDFKTDHSVLNI